MHAMIKLFVKYPHQVHYYHLQVTVFTRLVICFIKGFRAIGALPQGVGRASIAGSAGLQGRFPTPAHMARRSKRPILTKDGNASFPPRSHTLN